MRSSTVMAVVLWGCSPAPPDASDLQSDPFDLPQAVGAEITWVAAYQPLETVLHDPLGTGQVGEPGPILAKRELAIRVGVELHEEAVSDRLLVVVQARQGNRSATNHVAEGRARPADPNQPDSTFNVVIPAGSVTSDLSLEVSVRYQDPVFGPADPEERWRWNSGPLEVETTGRLDLVLLPVDIYDGAHYLPDLSDARIDEIRDALSAQYPVEGVDIRIDDPPLEWNEPFNSDVDFQALVDAAAGRRANSPMVGAKTYYYAMVAPPDYTGTYAGLGQVAVLATDEHARVAAGLADTAFATDVMLHEIGHNHGRYHVPCGNPAQIDPFYPHDPSTLGVRAWDRANDRIVGPQGVADFMSYCDPTWVSDYTFTGLHRRVRDLELQARSAPVPYRRGHLPSDGRGVLREVLDVRATPGGEPVAVRCFDASGTAVAEVDGYFFAFDHGGGGSVLLEDPGEEAVSFELVP